MYKLVEMYKNRISLKTCKVPNIHTYIEKFYRNKIILAILTVPLTEI
jgi:hypothetical protein